MSMSASEYSCCFCAHTQKRCLTPDCPCFDAGLKCQTNCRSDTHLFDCLNVFPAQCSCSPHCKKDKCACARAGESCNENCKCNGRCSNVRLGEDNGSRLPQHIACKCKKSCARASTKCPCRLILKYCTEACGCSVACKNNSQQQLPEAVRHIFTHPQHEAAAVFKLHGSTGYSHRLAFCSNAKKDKADTPHPEEAASNMLAIVVRAVQLPIETIDVYLSRSPCYHQDCNLQCQVLESCSTQRACAVRLCILLKQVQIRLQNANVKLNVKFLAPYAKRGDLYLVQGLKQLLECGISVEPLTLPHWSDLVFENDMKRQAASSKIAMWSAANLERYIAHGQQYVNRALNALGRPEGLWTSPFHETIKTTLIAAGLTLHKFDKIAFELGRQSVYSPTPVRLTGERSSRREACGSAARRAHSMHFVGAKREEAMECARRATSNTSLAEARRVEVEDTATQLEELLMNLATQNMTDSDITEISDQIGLSIDVVRSELRHMLEALLKRSEQSRAWEALNSMFTVEFRL